MNHTSLDQFHEMFLHLAGAACLGGVLGINRDLHHKPAGMRVLALVCMGAAAISMVSLHLIAPSEHATYDGVLRTIQGVLSGIGFLGAGVIMRSQGSDDVHGMTTATAIWVSAILGMICGLGQWFLALSVFLIAWTIMVVGLWVEHQVMRFAPPLKHKPPGTPPSAGPPTESTLAR